MATDNLIDLNILDKSKKAFPTRFYNDFFVSEYGRLEALRAARYGRSFSIVLMQVESLKGLDKKLDKKVLLEFLKKVITVVMDVVRNCDVVGMVHGKRIIVIFPESDYLGSLIAIRKLRRALSGVTLEGKPASIFFSQATFPRDANGYGELLSIAENRIDLQRNSLREQLDMGEKLLWENFALLLNKDVESPEIERFDLGDGYEYDASFRDRLLEMIMQDISRNPGNKGIMYFGLGEGKPDQSLIKLLESLGGCATKIFILGGDRGKRWDLPNVTPIFISDSRFIEIFFLLILREDMSYALISKESWGGHLSCVHTVDPYLIEFLIMKLQEDYSLQEQL